jgi:glutamate-1-semialdehyde 2,1-aminomutase
MTKKRQAGADKPAARTYAKSSAAHAAARKLMPGGVNSPVRAFGSVGREPLTITKGEGCQVTDADGNAYIDYVSSYGPLILGHAPQPVVAAINKAAKRGTTFGMPIEAETKLAEAVVDAVPSIEIVRFVNSGTEAMMSCVRLARGATGRDKVVKMIGGYHGHIDGLLVQAGSGATTLGVPSSPGVPASLTADTLLAPYNDLAAVKKRFAEHGEKIAAVCLEPIAGNIGCVPPIDGYLAGLRKLCDEHGALLVFDEVMTGFRVAYGGAQALYNVTPDLTALGKIIGGGLPCAAYGGREDIMRHVAPDGPVYQAGTLSGNPLAMAAGLATLEQLREPKVYDQLKRTTAKLRTGLEKAAAKAGAKVRVQNVGSMITPFFTSNPVTNYDEATSCDTEAFARFFGAMLDGGVTLPPSQYEAWFLSTAHDEQAIEQTLEAAKPAFAAAASGG